MSSDAFESDWQQHQREIWRLYLTENKSLKMVMEHMKQSYGFCPDKQQWIEKLKQWGCSKNLKKDGWRYVERQTRKRKQSGMDDNPYVVLAGVSMSWDQVKKGIRNHCSGPTLKLPRHRSPSPSLPKGLSLHVYTPPPLGDMSWPQNLPWLQFHHTTLQVITSMIENDAKGFSLTITAALSTSLKLPLKLFISHRRTDAIHKLLNLFMPESMPDEHTIRAESICQLGSYWSTITSIELALFFYSNYLDLPPYETSDTNMKIVDSNIIHLVEFFETVKPVMKILHDTGGATAQTLVDRFVASAIRLKRVDILHKLVDMGLDIRTRVRKEIKAYSEDRDIIAPIDLALKFGDTEMVDFLLGQGAIFTKPSAPEGNTTGASVTNSLDSTLFNYARHPGTAEASLTSRVLQSQRDSYSESQLLRCLRCMGNGGKAWRAAALPILDCLWKLETTHGLSKRLVNLFYAIRFRHEGMSSVLVSKVPDLEEIWGEDHTPGKRTLMAEAAWSKDLEACKMLLSHGANPDPLLSSSHSALQISAHLGDIQLVKFLLGKGADVNYTSHVPFLEVGASPLSAAIGQRRIPIVELLLDKDAKISAAECVHLDSLVPSDRLGLIHRLVTRNKKFAASVLIEAIRLDNVSLANRLIRLGLIWDCENEKGETPLAVAQSLEYGREVVQQILDADPARYDPVALLAATYSTTPRNGSQSTFKVLWSRRQAQTSHDSWGKFMEGLALATAACLGNEDIVSQLLEAGVVLSKNPRGLRGLFLTRLMVSDNNIQIYGIGPGSTHDHALVIPGATIIGTACRAKQPGIVRVLLLRGYKPNEIDLAIAARNMDLETIESLIKVGSQCNLGIIVARLISRGFTGLVDSLLNTGVDVNIRETSLILDLDVLKTPLEAAVAREDIKLVRTLIRLKAQMNSSANSYISRTALQIAAAHGNIAIARLLVENGADCNALGKSFF